MYVYAYVNQIILVRYIRFLFFDTPSVQEGYEISALYFLSVCGISKNFGWIF